MLFRSTYQFGTFLPKGPLGQVSSGIGMAVSSLVVVLNSARLVGYDPGAPSAAAPAATSDRR